MESSVVRAGADSCRNIAVRQKEAEGKSHADAGLQVNGLAAEATADFSTYSHSRGICSQP